MSFSGGSVAQPVEFGTIQANVADPTLTNPNQSKTALTLATTPKHSPTSSRRPTIDTALTHHKPHPADLVSLENPDPHHSPSPSPATPFTSESPFASPNDVLERPVFSSEHTRQDSNPGSEPSEPEGHHGHGPSSVDAHGVLASENGGTLGHGSTNSRDWTGGDLSSRRGSEPHSHEHPPAGEDRARPTADSAQQDQLQGVHSKLEALAINPKMDQPTTHVNDKPASSSTQPGTSIAPSGSVTPTGSHVSPAPKLATRSTAASNSNDQASSTTPRSNRTHGRSQSMASPTTTRSSDQPAPTARPRDPISNSTSSSRRDRERESQTNGRSSAKEGASSSTREGASSSSRSRRVLGEWTMTKTLGAGSMGKVKLAVSSVTGEKVAIKIIPRYTSTAAAYRHPPQPEGSSQPAGPPPPPTASFLAKAAAKDASKETRTTREGSLCMLLHHPYVCGMKSMILYPHHYYMVTEYVNGGQMLDYIISHGRLRERSARKFARQIGSALEYCHANSIVHRDLKIENILISKTGNIKIIDFGLSNLYSPVSHLSTFCGSLYFAAPELLNAKPYTGPEVDVWSFGIVLYVLVCGKVPFDDQSMPALHAKIKRGQVEYPNWLSAECKHLLSRMLVTTPATRATLPEVIAHPWMIKGYTGPPANHLPPRTPLRISDISREVINGMVGFEFGAAIDIEAKLHDVIDSDLYKTAVRDWEAKHAAGVDGDEEHLADRPAMRTSGSDLKRSPTNKRFSGLGFYGKRLAGGLNAAFGPGGGSSTGKTSGDFGGSVNGSTSSGSLAGSNGLKADPLDPTRGFHPLISIYYLVKEKMEREKIWGPGVFASSTLSLTGPPPPPAPAQAYQAHTGVITPVMPAVPKPGQLAEPDSAPARGSPRMPMTPQPRARAPAEEFPMAPNTAPPSRVDEHGRTSFADKRASYLAGSQSIGVASGARPTSQYGATTPRSASQYEPSSPTPQSRRSSSQADPARAGAGGDDVPLAPTGGSPGGGFVRRFGSLLGRSGPPVIDPGPGYKGHRQRASISGTGHKTGTKTALTNLPQVTEAGPMRSNSDMPIQAPPEGKPVVRSSTVGELSPSRHQRGVSLGGAASPTSSPLAYSNTVGRSAQDRARAGAPFPLDEAAEELALPDQDEQGDVNREQEDVGFIGRTPSQQANETTGAKQVWLKGLFSVATTSTKPTATIRADLIRVLDRLGVQHKDVKGGFECAHVPSIDLSSVGGDRARKEGGLAAQARGTIRRRASKLLLSTTTSKDDAAPQSPVNFGGEESQTSLSVPSGRAPQHQQPPASSASTIGSPHPQDRRGSVATQGGGSATADGSAPNHSDMIVRFEIFIVKMPWLLNVRGLQFRRVSGDAWQYQMLAKRVLQEIKL